jgi:hypothetical protein
VIPYLTNTAGEVEREARSRRANVVEVLALACVVFVVLWPISFGFGVLGGNDAIRGFAVWPLALLFAWVFLGSPVWHRDSPESLGLGNPLRLFRGIRERQGLQRWRLLAPVCLMFGILFAVSIANWPDTAKMFKLGSAAREWPLIPGGALRIFAFSTVMSAFVVLCVIRWDNIATAMRPVLIVSAALLLYSGAGAWLNHGSAAFERIDPAQYPLDVLAYAFWGATQQFFFTSYFATRCRKAVPPAPLAVSRGIRRFPPPVIFGGVTGAAAIAPPVWLAVRSTSGPEDATLSLLAWFLVFAFPVGAVWMHFYRKDPRRMLVATFSGSFFGLIHIDSYGLVLVTFGLGTILSYLFMEDRFRNLAAAGFAHGLLGSTFGKFFKTDAAGPLKVSYRVGPWSVEEPTVSVMIIPTVCLGIYVGLLIWSSRSRFFDPHSCEGQAESLPLNEPA